MEKARVIDSFGHVGLTPLGKIRLTLAGEIKMTPVEASAGEFFCSFETPCPGTAGINLKNYKNIEPTSRRISKPFITCRSANGLSICASPMPSSSW